MKRALCIWLPQWPIQRLVAAKPELKARPLVLHARDSRRGRLVVACCERASRFGVRSGMPLAEVDSLSRGEREKHALYEHEPELDDESLVELAIWCERFSPIVGLEEAETGTSSDGGGPSCLLLDVTGLAPIFESEERLIELIERAFEERGLQIRIGLADTVGAAWAIAHYGTQPIGSMSRSMGPRPVENDDEGDDSQALAPVPADSPHAEHIAQGPMLPGQNAQDQIAAQLNTLPVQALRLEAATVDTLYQLGVETIGQLMQLPRDGLATRLGGLLVRRIDQAFGEKPEVIVAHRPPPQFEADLILEHPTQRRDTIETILRRLTDTVSQTLAKNDHAAVQVEAELRGEKQIGEQQPRVRVLKISLFQPTSNPQHIFDLLKLQLESFQVREAVKRVRVAAVTTVRITGEQQVLWDESGQGRDRELAQLVDRFTSRLGKDCVFGVQAQAGALPERAYRKKLLSETVKSKRKRSQRSRQTTAETLKAPHRPLWLHDPPQPIRMTTVLRRRGSQPPAVFQFLNEQHQVARYWGPERIETGWWSGHSVRRDYYRVETNDGYRFWLFRQLSDSAWFLHGCFE